MSNYSEGNDFEDILERLLDRVDDSIDKRQGSIIYDALAPAAAELAQCYIALDVYTDQTYLLTATGDNLDNRVADYGLTRKEATYAQRIIKTYDTNNTLMAVDIGTRFAVPNASGGYNFTILAEQTSGTVGIYIAQCETAGSYGNEYTGDLLPLTSVNNLGSAQIDDIYKPGEDEETDEELRARALNKINQESFGGNKADYKEFTKAIDGVEKCKIFPVWNGGGTVKVAIISTNNTIPTTTFVNNVQELIDPVANHGEGVGIAPIGHTVTVVAPTKLDIDITATITPKTGYTVAELETSINTQIAKYIAEVQEQWEDNDTLIIYTSKVIAAILGVPEVQNVSNLTINSSSSDLTINITSSNLKFPVLGEVTLNAS